MSTELAPVLVSEGNLLRAWRTRIYRRSQSQTVASLPPGVRVSTASLSQWESGAVLPPNEHVLALDELYGAKGALRGLTWAMGTPRGLAPRQRWEGNYPTSATDVWTWIRPSSGRRSVDALLEWGPISMHLARRCGPEGVIVTSPASLPNPALVVTIRSNGWVDFGVGPIPRELGAPVVNGVLHIRFHAGAVPLLNHFVQRAKRRFSLNGDWRLAINQAVTNRHDLVESALAAPGGKWEVRDRTEIEPVPFPPSGFTGDNYRRLREARGLSQREAADAATELDPAIPIKPSDIESCERGRNVQRQGLRPRLDMVYGADGYSCVEVVPVRQLRQSWTVDTPSYWVGPVSIAASDPARGDVEGTLTLRWNAWEFKVKVRSGAPLGLRQAPGATSQLEVLPPPGWKVAAAIGRHPGAGDANKGWLPRDDRVFVDVERTWSRILGRRYGDKERIFDDDRRVE